MDVLLKDLKHAVRLLIKVPSVSLAAIAALTLGIGTSTAIFSVVNRVLLNPFTYPDPERVVMFQNTFAQWPATGSSAPTEFNWWRQQTPFQDVSAYAFGAGNVTGESSPEQIPTMNVSADFFRLFGATPIHGRTFSAADDVPNAPKTTVLSYGFWQRHFGGDPDVIGQRLVLNGEVHEIIGVIGQDLAGGQVLEQSLGSGAVEIHQQPDAYLPFQLDPNSTELRHYFNVAGRLRPTVSLAVANARLQASYRDYARTWGSDITPGAGFRVEPLPDAIVGATRPSLLILLAAVSVVLLMACANVANLLLARAALRTREFAIRGAVGAGRLRIVRQLLTESLLLSLIGGALGAAAGYGGIRVLLRFSPGNIPRLGPDGSLVVMDWRVLGFALALSILTPILFGLVPALRSARGDLSAALKESADRTGTGARHSRTRVALVTVQMSLAVVLLIAAALLIRTFVAVQQVDPGIETRNVVTMRMLFAGPQFDTAPAMTQVIQDGIRRIRALPGVEAAATTCCVPFEDRFFVSFEVAGRPEIKAASPWIVVSPNYFETFNIPVTRGRTFRDEDDTGARAVIINEAFAGKVWPNGDPTSDRLILGEGDVRQIIGVVRDVSANVTAPAEPIIYTLSAHLDNATASLLLPTSPWAWVIRTQDEPQFLASEIQGELRQASGGLSVARVRTMDEVLSQATARETFNMLVLTVFGLAALLLAAVGIYGVATYSVTQRAREIAVRLALGAHARGIRNMVVMQGLRPVAIGTACGLAAAFAFARLLSGLLFQVQPHDPLVFLAAPAVLLGVALLAVWLPALRASRVDPIHALRSE